jgi:PD-(D/E)XK endonuclease
MTTREQGDFGELSAMQWLVGLGAKLALPVGHSPDWDLIAELDGRLLRVQVKTTRRRQGGRWSVMVCTRGGNQSWTGIAKYFDVSRCDYLFVHVADGRRWFIPSKAIEGRTAIALGGPKYAEFEVEAGAQFPLAGQERGAASTIAA